MALWQMDVMGRVHLADGREVKVVTGIDDHLRFIVCARVVVRATARPVCLALRRHGIPEQILTGNGIRHLLTAPYSPTTTGKAERLHKTMRAEFFTPEEPDVRDRGAAAGGPGRVGGGVQHRPPAPVLRRSPAHRPVPAR